MKWFDAAVFQSAAGRIESERYRDYYDGRQLTAEQRSVLAARLQPPVVTNRIARKVNYLLGYETKQRTDPRAFPKNSPQDDASAEAATDAIRYVCDKNKFNNIRSGVWENMLVEGMGGAELRVEKSKKGNPEIIISRIAWERLFADPYSRDLDFHDARYKGYVTWMDYQEAREKWPAKAQDMEEGYASFDGLNDRPENPIWVDSKRRRVRIVYMYYKKAGQWRWCIFTKGAKLEGGESPYVDQEGETYCPLIMASMFVDRDNDRYGIVRNMMDLQDEVNKRRSKLLHSLNVNQVISEKGAVEDPELARSEAAKPDGFIEVTPGMRFEISKNSELAAGHVLLLQEAKTEIDEMGANPAMLGTEAGQPSGRALLARQQGGAVELARPMDLLSSFSQRVYEGVWCMVKQYWTEQTLVRVTDNEQNVKFIGLNRPITAIEKFQRALEESGRPPEEMQAAMQEARQDPRANIIVGLDNNVGEIDVDITIEEVPDVATIQFEQFEQLVALAQAGIQFPPEVYIRASQLRNKKELLELMSGKQSPEQMQVRQKMETLTVDAAEAKVRRDNAAASKDEASALKITEEIGVPESEPAPQDPLEREKLQADIHAVQARTLKELVSE